MRHSINKSGKGSNDKEKTGIVKEKALPSESEFPSMVGAGSKKNGSGAWGSEKRFADLARSWGVQQKEEEEERKRLAKQKATEEMIRREREEKERTFYRVGLARATQLIYRENREEDDGVYDLGGAKPVEREELEMDSDTDGGGVEEEEVRGNGGVSDGYAPRKSRYELY
jgi:hypothetical protein